MIGIDTNILLRLWLNHDPAQNKRIDALLATTGLRLHGNLRSRHAQAAWGVKVL